MNCLLKALITDLLKNSELILIKRLLTKRAPPIIKTINHIYLIHISIINSILKIIILINLIHSRKIRTINQITINTTNNPIKTIIRQTNYPTHCLQLPFIKKRQDNLHNKLTLLNYLDCMGMGALE